MATKTTNDTRKSRYTEDTSYWVSGKWVPNAQIVTYPTSSYVTTSKTSTVTPFYRNKLLRPRPLPVNAYSINREQRYAILGSWTSYSAKTSITVVRGVIEAPIGAPTGMDSSQIAALDQKTLYKFYGRIKDQKVDLAQVFAERNQTARLIGDTAISIADSIISFRKSGVKAGLAALGIGNVPWHQSKGAKRRGRKQRSGTSSGQQLATRWLELQYGWKPLLDDCFGAAEALAKGNLNLPPPTRVSSNSKVVPYERVTQTKILGLTSIDREKGTHYIKYFCEFLVNGEVSMATSLGLTNPVHLAWELLPYSFVADWFFNIGGWISTWDATLGCSFVSGGKSVVTKGHRTISRDWFILPGSTNGRYGYGIGSSNSETFVRSKLTSFPTVPLPVYKDGTSIEHMWNGIALLQNAFTSFKKP